MTKKEHEQIKAWNIEQGKAMEKAEADYKALRQKYIGLIGHLSCSYERVILEIATCDKTTEDEKRHDLSIYSNYLIAFGRYRALFDYVTAHQGR
ncbi:MAG: hypothetical protein HDT28_00540 [Clostridiales bacterium]|nr:hypothetical protein [Clostridiales bacterium]